MSTIQEPTKLLDDDTIYLAFDRWVCGRETCAGMTAAYTGRTIGGYSLVPITADMIDAWPADCGPLVCQCGRVTVR